MNTDLDQMNNPIGFDAEEGFWRFLSRIQKAKSEPINRFRRRIIKLHIPQVAAMLAFLMLGAFLSYHYFKSESPTIAYYETIVPLGAKSQIVLTDGTKVWLNAGSRLRYPTTYSVSNRDVFLEGEAYFEVAHNANLPFEVKTSMLNVKAIGTSFNVKAYANDSTVETTLVEGKIVVSGIKEQKNRNIVLLPNQTLTLYKERKNPTQSNLQASKSILPEEIQLPVKIGNAIIASESDVAHAIAWRNNKLIFVKERLGDVKVKMERWYDVRIEVKNPEIEDYIFTGTFEKETFEQAMTALSEAASCEFKINKNVAIVMKK